MNAEHCGASMSEYMNILHEDAVVECCLLCCCRCHRFRSLSSFVLLRNTTLLSSVWQSQNSLGNQSNLRKHSVGPLSFLLTDVVIFEDSLLSCCSGRLLKCMARSLIHVQITDSHRQLDTKCMHMLVYNFEGMLLK